MSPLQDLKHISDLKYQNILLGYTYFCEVNPVIITYDQAISLTKKVLPDDVIEKRVKEDTDAGK